MRQRSSNHGFPVPTEQTCFVGEARLFPLRISLDCVEQLSEAGPRLFSRGSHASAFVTVAVPNDRVPLTELVDQATGKSDWEATERSHSAPQISRQHPNGGR